MRHKLAYRKLNRTSEHRKALFKNMLNSLIKYEQVTTTLPKAKELKPKIDKVITLGKKNNLQSKKNSKHVLATNEGSAISIGIGYYLGKKDKKFDTSFITSFAANVGSPAMIIYALNVKNVSFEIFLLIVVSFSNLLIAVSANGRRFSLFVN